MRRAGTFLGIKLPALEARIAVQILREDFLQARLAVPTSCDWPQTATPAAWPHSRCG